MPATNRLYSIRQNERTFTADYAGLSAAGVLSPRTFDTPVAHAVLTPPLRFTPDASRLAAGDGRVFNPEFSVIGTLANSIADAAWLPTALGTVRRVRDDTVVQRWSRDTYALTASATLPGVPQRILRLTDTQLLVVITLNGQPLFTLLNSELSFVPVAGGGDYAGAYFGRLASPAAGDIALHLRANRSGAVALYATAPTRTAIVASSFQLNADGSFVASGRE